MRRLLVAMGIAVVVVALAGVLIELLARGHRGTEITSTSARLGKLTVVAALIEDDDSLYASIEWRRISFLSDQSVEHLVATSDREVARAYGHYYLANLSENAKVTLRPTESSVVFHFGDREVVFDLRTRAFGPVHEAGPSPATESGVPGGEPVGALRPAPSS